MYWYVRASKAPKEGAELLLGEDESVKATMMARHGALFELRFDDERDVLSILNQIGHMPLPPYIDRYLMKKRIKSFIKLCIVKNRGL